ncbi:MAG: hypothetical protein R3C53_21585 [Pirellulaceae bacterium]
MKQLAQEIERNKMKLLLSAEAALAVRLIRSSGASGASDFWLWLSEPTAHKSPPPNDNQTAHAAIQGSMDEIIAPMLEDAAAWEVKEARYAPAWLASICLHIAQTHFSRGRGCSVRLLATSLLPLYRTLATGKLKEGFQQARARLTETLLLLELCDELSSVANDDFHDLLEAGFHRNSNPVEIMQEQLGIGLEELGQQTLHLIGEFDSASGTLSIEACQQLRSGHSDYKSKAPEWAAPDLLWKLAGELISKKSEMVLPRSWIDTPVPWSSIADHWNSLAHLLSNLPNENPGNGAAASDPATAVHQAGLDDLLGSELSNASASANSSIENQLDEISQSVEKMFRRQEQLENVVRPTDSGPVPVLPKVIIAEIRSHNDPVFVNVLKRQIGSCRAEDRTICLAHIVVHPEDETDRGDVCGKRDNGLTLWQQKLVNWLADHPEVVDPYAFLTSEGELILCILDLERNQMTSILRQGLIEVLTGKRVEEVSEMSLAKVHVPARFHVGIAATSAPSSNFAPEQLIEPAIRCLSAASRQGKASIKSIEVF